MAKKNKKVGKKSAKNLGNAVNLKDSSGDSDTSMPAGNSCGGMSGLLCTLSMVAAVFFLLSLVPSLGSWVMGVQWWIWLLVAVVLGFKPMMKCCKK